MEIGSLIYAMRMRFGGHLEFAIKSKNKGEKEMMITKHTAQTIQTIDELVMALSEGEKSTYGSLLRNMNLSKDEFKPHQTWSKNAYTRNCIVENEFFELILICWAGEQMTPIHDHGGEECWVYFIDGDFEEIIYTIDENQNPVVSRKIEVGPGHISYMIDFMGVHRLRNCSKTGGMSLHLYAKPIKSCHVFNEETSAFSPKEMSYNTKA